MSNPQSVHWVNTVYLSQCGYPSGLQLTLFPFKFVAVHVYLLGQQVVADYLHCMVSVPHPCCSATCLDRMLFCWGNELKDKLIRTVLERQAQKKGFNSVEFYSILSALLKNCLQLRVTI